MKTIIAGNWKMNLTVAQSVALAVGVVERAKAATQAGAFDVDSVDIVIAPTSLALYPVAEATRGSVVGIAGQNCHYEDKGAFTGEISTSMLVAAGASYGIVGHSERRQLFGESDESVAQKAKALLDGGLTPIVCIGETLEERERGQTMDIVSRQLVAVLNALTQEETAKIVLAYEPVWAIGTGRTASPEQAQEVHANLREVISRHSGSFVADRLRIQYGGSVKPANAADLLSQPDINGALVGGASLDAESFLAIVTSS